VLHIASTAVRVLSSEKGAMAVVYDEEGDGNALMMACGNQFIVGPMIRAVTAIARDKFFDDVDTQVVQ
jgi:uncharacterized protein YjfI (DUF2170 family)